MTGTDEKDMVSETGVDWGFACGRYYLAIDRFVVAMETDVCRDIKLKVKFCSEIWTEEMIKYMAQPDRQPIIDWQTKAFDRWAANLPESHEETPYNRAWGFLGAAVVYFVLWGIVIATALIVAR
jgi:hypothetical protein